MLTAIYVRVSSEKQEKEGYSLPSQKRACLEKAAQIGGEVPGDLIFTESWSGADLDRPELNKLREFTRARQVDCLIVYSTDRLSRDPIHLAILAEECEKNHVRLEFVTEPLDNSPEGALIRYVKGYASQIERVKIRERVMRGKKEKARAGTLSMGGPAPYGYTTNNKKRFIDPAAAPTVQMIFDWFSRGTTTLCRAATELNRRNIPGPAGGRWSEAAVHRLLTNPCYKGQTYAFRYGRIEPKQHKKQVRYNNNKVILRDSKDWMLIPGATPAIVSPEVWQAANDNLTANKKGSQRNRKYEYLLINGRLRCGTCGLAMHGSVKKRNGKPYFYYRCIKTTKTGYYRESCKQPMFAIHRIDDMVWKEIVEVVKHPDQALREFKARRSKELPAILEAELIAVKAKQVKLLKEREKYIQLYGQELIEQDELTNQLNRIKGNQESLTAQQLDLERRLVDIAKADEQYQDLSEALKELAGKVDNATYEDKLQAMEWLDIRVTLHRDGKLLLTGLVNSGAIVSASSYSLW